MTDKDFLTFQFSKSHRRITGSNVNVATETPNPLVILGRTLLLLVGVVGLVGCAGPKPAAKARPGPGGIAELHMLSMPIAMNLDAAPGIDGLAVKLYAVARAEPKPTPITDGRVEILMYDGAITGRISETNQPLHVWAFPAEKLPEFRFKTTIGTGYALTLPWGEDRPQEKRVTILARYLKMGEMPVYSAPHSVSVAGQ